MPSETNRTPVSGQGEKGDAGEVLPPLTPDDVASPSSVVAAHFPNTRRRIEETSPEKADSPPPPLHHGADPSTGETDADDEEEGVTVETLLSHNDVPNELAHPSVQEGGGEEKKGVLPSRYYRQIRARRGEVAARVNQRMEEATRRREELLQQRKQHLIDVERRRQQKVHQVKGMRLAALGTLIRKGLEPLDHLQRAGLHVNVAAEAPTGMSPETVAALDALEQQLTPDAIEMILVSDRRACDICEQDQPASLALENKAKPVCPHTNKPHRRSLVVAAEKFLKLVGDTRVNLVGSRLEAVGSSTPAAARQKAKRGIAVNPQLFVLSYYTSVLPVGEVDALLKEYAASLVYATEQLRAALVEAQNDSPPPPSSNPSAVPQDTDNEIAKAHESYLKPLLQSFARAWRRYSQLSDQQILQNISPEGRESATQELIQSTTVALESTYRKVADTASALQALQQETNSDPADATSDERTAAEGGRQLRIARLSTELTALSAFISMLRTRLARIGGKGALEAFDKSMENADQRGDDNAAAPTDDYSDYTPERQRNSGVAANSYFSTANGSEMGPASPVIASPLMTSAPPNTPALPSTTSARSGAVASAFERSDAAPISANVAARLRGPAAAGPEEYVGTSGSDSELGSSSMSPARQQQSYGPELPPLWYVDSDGKSKPPTEETVRREEHSKLEYRARSAYTAKMKRDAMKTKAEEEWRDAAEQLSKQFDEAMWVQVASELDAQPPVVHRLPNLLSAVAESLIDALPRRIRNKIGQEIRDVLDWGLLRRQLATASTEKRVESIVSLMIYVVNRVGQLGAPAKEDALKEEAQSLAAAAKCACDNEGSSAAASTASSSSASQKTVGEAVVAIFRFMFSAIQDLRKDIAEYSLKLVSHELVENAVKYETAFVEAVLPAPSQWTTTRQFLAASITEARTAPCLVIPPNLVDAVLRSSGGGTTPSNGGVAHPHTPGTPLNVTTMDALPPSTLYITEDDKEVFSGLVFGLVDLVRTGGKLPEARWTGYPKEAFYFARPLIFDCANSVQLLTLRLMISGTVSMILAPIKLHATPLQSFLQYLDDKVQKWLSKVANNGNQKPPSAATKVEGGLEGEEVVNTIEDIKDAVVEEVHSFLASAPQQQSVYTSTTSAAAQTARASGGSLPATQLPPLELGESDEAVLRNVLGKLTDTGGTQYVTFEGRILRAIFGVLLESVATHSSGINAETTTSTAASSSRFNPKLRAGSACAQRAVGGLVLEGVKEAGALLAAVLLHNWAVYRKYYRDMMMSDSSTAPSLGESN
jgi:hypothetical protein